MKSTLILSRICDGIYHRNTVAQPVEFRLVHLLLLPAGKTGNDTSIYRIRRQTQSRRRGY
jgi:hypothetical protein